jgi:uncharacterized protein
MAQNPTAGTGPDMSQDLIRYDILLQEAMRGVVRKVMGEVARTGLPGNHHFFITFVTGAPGVRISSRLREKYPEQMTIVVQHQYWDLEVSDSHFEIGLSFGDVPERLSIPFLAVRGFYDPSVSFELEIDDKLEPEAKQAETAPTPLLAPDKAKAKLESVKAKSESKKPAADAEEGGEAKPIADVVSLDSFRKKK